MNWTGSEAKRQAGEALAVGILILAGCVATPTAQTAPPTVASTAKSFNSIQMAHLHDGGDCGEKIGQALEALGGPGEIWINQACGLMWTTPVVLGTKQVLRFVQPGTYVTNKTIELRGPGSGILGPPCPDVEGGGNTCPVAIQEAAGANLPSLLLMSREENFLENLTLDGNCGWTANPTTCTHNPASQDGVVVAGLRSQIYRVHTWRFNRHGIYIHSLGRNEAAATHISSSVAVANGGDGLLIEETSDCFLLYNQFENNRGYGLQISGGSGNRFVENDFGGNTAGGVYIQGKSVGGQPGFGNMFEANQFGANNGHDVYVNGWDTAGNYYGAFGNQFVGNYNIGLGGSCTFGISKCDAYHFEDSYGNTVESFTVNVPSTDAAHNYRFVINSLVNSGHHSGPNDFGPGNVEEGNPAGFVSIASGVDRMIGVGFQNYVPTFGSDLSISNNGSLWWQDRNGAARAIMTLDSNNIVTIKGHPGRQTIVLQPEPGTNGLVLTGNGAQLKSTRFASLPSLPPGADGTMIYCADCTVSNSGSCSNVSSSAACACAGAGSGAIAKRINGVWLCN